MDISLPEAGQDVDSDEAAEPAVDEATAIQTPPAYPQYPGDGAQWQAGL